MFYQKKREIKGVLVLTFGLFLVTPCVEDNSEFFLQDLVTGGRVVEFSGTGDGDNSDGRFTEN